jgi:hypothetical protein
VKRFQGGPVLKADTLLYDSSLGKRVIKKKEKLDTCEAVQRSGVGIEVPVFWV